MVDLNSATLAQLRERIHKVQEEQAASAVRFVCSVLEEIKFGSKVEFLTQDDWESNYTLDVVAYIDEDPPADSYWPHYSEARKRMNGLGPWHEASAIMECGELLWDFKDRGYDKDDCIGVYTPEVG